jgi:8-oxo-dGTP diphosphatase
MLENTIKDNKNKPFQVIQQQFELYIPQLSIDCVIFGFHDNSLKVLLSKFAKVDIWALQGGFIFQDEDIDVAAVRILKELTGLSDIYLKQYTTFGKANRGSQGKNFDELFKKQGINIDEIPFLKQRFVSIGYYSLVDFEKASPSVSLPYFDSSEWYDIDNLPDLIFDHAEMIHIALATLRQSLDYQLVGFNLMPEIFTMKELQRLYETILGEPLKRNNFQEKILGLNILERLEKQYSGGAHKAPYLYKFK